MRERIENAKRDHKGKIIYPYKPAQGGRVEVRFRNKDEKISADSLFNEIKSKTGLNRDKILVKALEFLNKNTNEKGNIL